MIECTECGFRNEDDDHFCGGCQEPLEWTGRRIDEVEEDLAEEDPEATDERGGLVERVLERLDKRGVEDPGPTEDQVEVEPERVEQDVASTVTADVVARAEREVEEAVRAQSEAEQRAQEQAAAAEQARVRAEEARAARERAEQSVQAETEEAARVRQELEAAKAARHAAEEELERESEAAADARRLADEFGDEQRRHEAVEVELQQEREAIERAQAELEQAEAARREAEERAQAEAEAAEQAARAAAAAEEARAAAEARAREEAAAAEQARRAAALVARPKPAPPDEHDGTTRSSTSGRRPEKKGRQKKGRQKQGRRGEDRTSGASGPGPREPDRPKIRKGGPQRKQQPSRRLRPGDRICGQCGEGNIPTRNYCRRCGDELHEAEVVRRPWWKRWIPRRKPRAYEAGERPDRSGRSGGGGTGGVKGAVRSAQGLRRRIMGPIGKVARVLAIVVVAAGAAGLAFNPDLRSRVTEPATDAFEWVRQRIAPQLARVNPVAVEASSARADTADGLCCAADNVEEFGNTWWHASEGGVGQFLVLTLDTPTTITDFGIIPGAGDDTIWTDHPRPRDLEVDFLNDQARTVATVDITDINDDHGDEAQVFRIDGAEDVTSVRVTVTRVYGDNLDSDDVAISEIRLWTRR